MKLKKLSIRMMTMALILAMMLCMSKTSLAESREDVTPEVPANTNIAQIGDVEYASLQEAIDAAKTTKVTIKLLRDVTDGTGFKIGSESGLKQSITIDFNGHTYNITSSLVGSTGTQTNGVQLLAGSSVVLKNGTLSSEVAKILVQNYSNLTITDMTLVDKTASYVLSSNNGKVSINGNTSIIAGAGEKAFDLYYWPDKGYNAGTQITVNTTGTITGDIELSASSNEDKATSLLTIQNINLAGEIKSTEALDKCIKVTGGKFENEDISKYVPSNCKIEIIDGKYVISKKPSSGSSSILGPAKVVVVEYENSDIKFENKEEATKVIKESLEKDLSNNRELARSLSGKDVEISLEIKGINVSDELKTGFEVAMKKINSNAKVEKYYEIILVIKTNGTKLGELSELTKNIKLMINVPEDVAKARTGYQRNIYMVRNHSSKTEVLHTKLSDDKAVFDSDKFSTYALAYTETKSNNASEKDNTPKTGYRMPLAISILSIVMIANGISYVAFKRQK